VYAYDPLSSFDPGPDGPDEDREKTTVEVSATDKKTLGVWDLVAHTADRNGAEESRLVWNGRSFAEPPRHAPISILAHLAMVLNGKRLGILDAVDRQSLTYLRNAAWPASRSMEPSATRC